mmetsp:Transcript_13332/g.22655  ORF Transcript_13332/g.22655 Transcript_13332/m.22655 type:complete len:122 (-) Transcript_13332:223-588(-)
MREEVQKLLARETPELDQIELELISKRVKRRRRQKSQDTQEAKAGLGTSTKLECLFQRKLPRRRNSTDSVSCALEDLRGGGDVDHDKESEDRTIFFDRSVAFREVKLVARRNEQPGSDEKI